MNEPERSYEDVIKYINNVKFYLNCAAEDGLLKTNIVDKRYDEILGMALIASIVYRVPLEQVFNDIEWDIKSNSEESSTAPSDMEQWKAWLNRWGIEYTEDVWEKKQQKYLEIRSNWAFVNINFNLNDEFKDIYIDYD
jgi:hypothetical protein